MLHPLPDRCVIDIEIALLQQLLNIGQRERIATIPPDLTKDDAGFGLPPFEDRRSGYHFAIGSRYQPATPKAATYPPSALIYNFALRNFLAPLQCPPDRSYTSHLLVLGYYARPEISHEQEYEELFESSNRNRTVCA